MKTKNYAFITKLSMIILWSVFTSHNVNAQTLNPSSWPHLKGYWKFQDAGNLTKATAGNNLILVGTHSVVPGPAYRDTAIRISIGSYYRCNHNILPNGGGDSVNRYSLMFDFKVLNFDRWHTFFQTDSTNMNDGECFIRPNTGTNPGCIGTATTGYTPNPIMANKWYRLVISVNLDHTYRYYLNGSLVLDGDTQFVDKRFALTRSILFFADNDQEDDTIDIASVAIFDTCLTDADVARLGSIEPCVANPPHVNLGIDTVLCNYSTLPKNAGTGYKKYLWSTGDTTAGVTFGKKNLVLGQNTVWVRVTDVNNCTARDTVKINFAAPTVVSLGKDSVTCEGKTVLMRAGTSSSNKYLWLSIPAKDTLTKSATYLADTSGIYVAFVTSNLGCVNSDTIRITVNPNPPKPVIHVTGKTSFCSGDSVRLEGPAGYKEYLWSQGTKQAFDYIKKSNTIKLQVKDNNNCFSPFSDSIRIVVFTLPQKPSIQVIGKSAICKGDSVILSAPGGYSLYSWSNGATFRRITVFDSGTFSVNVTDTNGCKSTESAETFIRVFPNPPKPYILVNGKTEFCEGETTSLSGPAGYSVYFWSDSSTSMAVNISETGAYSVFVTDSNGCKSEWSDSINILVHPLPPKPTIIDNIPNICSSTTGDYYFWFYNNVPMPDTTICILAYYSGMYKVMVRKDGCLSDTSDNTYIHRAGISESSGRNYFLTVFPNPAGSEVFIKVENLKTQGSIDLSILDLSGRNVIEKKLTFSELSSGINLDVSRLEKGFYILNILTDNQLILYKLEKK